jgi:hypothetical protein
MHACSVGCRRNRSTNLMCALTELHAPCVTLQRNVGSYADLYRGRLVGCIQPNQAHQIRNFFPVSTEPGPPDARVSDSGRRKLSCCMLRSGNQTKSTCKYATRTRPTKQNVRCTP